MPNNPLVDAFRYLFTGSPEQGPGLFSPQNIGNAMGQTGQDIQTIMAPTRMPTVNVNATRIPQPTPSVPPIDVGAVRQQFVQNMGAQQMAGTQQPKDEKQGGGINWQMLMDIGIPALSAIVGTAAPGTLAGAAGLSTGYTGAREKQREQQFELDKEEKKRQIEAEEDKKKEIKRRAEKIVEVASETYKNPDEVLREIEAIEQKLDIPTTKVGQSLKKEKSPFEEYPDAFQEDGVWKVIKNNEKYRIE